MNRAPFMMAVYQTTPVYLVQGKELLNGVSMQHEHNPRLERESSLKAHKQLPRRRDIENGLSSLRFPQTISPQHGEAIQPAAKSSRSILTAPSSTNPVLPPTPPSASLEDENHNHESGLVTPTNKQDPPTPDDTPPRNRPFLRTQPSMTSTRAESFKTAREEFLSDDEYDLPVPDSYQPFSRSSGLPAAVNGRFRRRPSPLAVGRSDNGSTSEPSVVQDLGHHRQPSRNLSESNNVDYVNGPASGDKGSSISDQEHRLSLVESRVKKGAPTDDVSPVERYQGHPIAGSKTRNSELDDKTPIKRGLSLRDRVAESRQNAANASTEQFGREIGWLSDNDRVKDLEDAVNSWRHSTTSTASMIEAMVVVDTTPKRQQTLRHRGKNNSLRSASSPIPPSHRDSLISNPDSPHRLLHKKARLNNQNRWSFGSEASRSVSMYSAIAVPKPEVIRVAVIPERGSSLMSSANSSKRESMAFSAGSWERHETTHRRRTLSETLPVGGSAAYRGRDRRYPPPVPARSSSLSAPTSRNNSRTNSISSTSEHLRAQRVAAEADLRKTLDRMESERLIPRLKDLNEKHSRTIQSSVEPVVTDGGPLTPEQDIMLPEPSSAGWGSERPPSLVDTPFTQHSILSLSPGPVEMGEARAVNFFPHNNYSLQLIEKHPLQESSAVREVHELMANGPMTPSTIASQPQTHDSPLRNPRRPPEPPKLKVIPPTPAAAESADKQLGTHENGEVVRAGGRLRSVRRPPAVRGRNSESFLKSLTRNLSLKNARNKKAEKEVDGKLHPLWRPRGFWDGISDSDGESVLDDDETLSVVSNSLGIPQQRTVINGPISLVRHISDSSRWRWQSRGIVKKSSYASLSQLRAGRKMHKLPGFGIHFQIVGLRDVQERMLLAKQRKEDEKLEKRRADLRKSIGTNIISQGDSRFPANLSRKI